MKFTSVIASTAAIAAVVSATSVPAGLPSGATQFAGSATGTIECDVGSKICTVTCDTGLAQGVCDLVAVFDSVFYGIEVLAGATVDCTEKGCSVYCPVDGTGKSTHIAELDN